MIFPSYYQPDQGYYTQQPATVAQVNNLWGFVKALRDELSQAVNEFNSHEYDLEKNFDEAHKYTDSVKSELSKLISKLNDDFESLDTLLGETAADLESKIGELEENKIGDVSLSGEEETLKIAVTDGVSTEYKNVRFTSPEDETAITTELHTTDDGTVEVLQIAPHLEDGVIAKKFGVEEDSENDTVANITYAGEKVAGIELLSLLLDVNVEDGNIVIDSDSAEHVIGTIQSNITKINSTAQSAENSFLYPREVNDEVNLTVSRETLDGKKRVEQNIPLVSDGGEFSTQDGKIRYEPSDEFAEKFSDLRITSGFVDPQKLLVRSETATYSYNRKSKKVEKTYVYDKEAIVFDRVGTDGILANFVYDSARDLVAIDTTRLEKKYDEHNTATQNALKDLTSRIEALEDEVALLKARESNSIIQVKPVIRATSNDKIEITLQCIYADGSHDESKPVILNFRNNDHSMSIITRDNRTVSSQCDVQINMDKIWLNRQGLDRDMDTF